MSNKAIWNEVCTTDPQHAKEFSGKGGFRGTSANPMYLAERCTEVFGPCGIGWGHEEIERVITGKDDDQVWFSHVKLWYIHDGQRGEVSHWGSSSLTEVRGRNSDKPYVFVDGEAAKKARTNAVSKCLSLLGFCADLWLGYYNSREYREGTAKEVTAARKRRESQENANGLLLLLLNQGIGCETDDDRNTVLSWAFGEPTSVDDVEPVEAQKVVKGKVKDAGLAYPAVLETARKMTPGKGKK